MREKEKVDDNLAANRFEDRDDHKKGVRRNVGHLSPDLQSALHAIQSVPLAKKALRTLIESGCDQNALILNLFLYCGGDSMTLKMALKSAQHFTKRLNDLASQLQTNASEVDRMLGELKDAGYAIYGFRPMCERMQEFAEFLSSLHGSFRLGTTQKSGRNKHLIYLVSLVRAATDEPHYKELAALIGAVSEKTNLDVVRAADALRNIVNRHDKKHPAHSLILAFEAKNEASEWKTAVRRKTRRH